MFCTRFLPILCLITPCAVSIADELDTPPTIDDLIEERYSICTAENSSRVWNFALKGFTQDSPLLKKGVPHVVEILGEPLGSERNKTGFWDVDVYVFRRILTFEGVKIVTYDFINQGSEVDLDTADVEDGRTIYQMVVDGQHHSFAFGLRIGSTREQVENALHLPCGSVAKSGRLATRQFASYNYLASDPDSALEYAVTIHFDNADKVRSVVWSYEGRH